MEREFWTLKKVERIIDVPRPVGMRKDFSCVLVTEYVHGKPLFMYMRTENGLYDKLTAMAHTQRKLHENTVSEYRKQDEFAYSHKVLDQLRLDRKTRLKYDQLLRRLVVFHTSGSTTRMYDPQRRQSSQLRI